MKRDKVVVRAKFVVGYWEFIPMESWDEFSAPQETATVRVAEERRAEKKQRNHWLTESKRPRIKEALVNSRYTSLRGHFDEACLEVGFDPVPKKRYSMFYRGLAGS